jgi:uncharacterized protein (TIGR02996 family)
MTLSTHRVGEEMDERRIALEASIAQDPDNVEAYLVYADYLQGIGDPWGELIAVMVELERAPTPLLEQRRDEILAESERFLPGVSEEHVTIEEWSRGYFRTVRFENQEDWMSDDWDVLPVARRVLERPQTRGLRELRVGILRWMHQHEDAPRLLEEVARQGLAAQIEILRVGDIDTDIDLAHHPLGDLGVIGREYSGLRELLIHGSDFELETLSVPRLETLTIETCGLARENLRSVVGEVSREHLTSLVLWFGSQEYGADATMDDVLPLLTGETLPRLQHLGLMNSEIADGIVAALPASPLLPRIRSLDLSLGTLSDEGAQPLLDYAEAFAHLERLNIDDNFLSEDRVARIRETLDCPVFWEESKEDDDPEWRYVTFSE